MLGAGHGGIEAILVGVAAAVYGVQAWGIAATEGVIGLFALVSVGIIWRLYERTAGDDLEAPEGDGEPLAPVRTEGQMDVPADVAEEKLDESRYL